MKNSSHVPTKIAEQIENRWFAPRMKQAVRLALEGKSYRHAAEIAGLRSHQDVARSLASIPGAREAHLRAWRASWGEQFPTMWAQHVRKLDEAA